MNNIKKPAFTLPEVLITLTIVGALAVIVLPGLIKDSNNRAMMSHLVGTVSTLNSAVQNELVNNGTKDITSTEIYTNPANFLSRAFDIQKICSGNDNTCMATSYKSLNGTSVTLSFNQPVLLKNGAAVDIKDNKVSIDLNGAQEPNIVGVDNFLVCIFTETDKTKGIHSGDVSGCYDSVDESSEDSETTQLKKNCKAGNPASCYMLAEQSGFDPNYLNTND